MASGTSLLISILLSVHGWTLYTDFTSLLWHRGIHSRDGGVWKCCCLTISWQMTLQPVFSRGSHAALTKHLIFLMSSTSKLPLLPLFSERTVIQFYCLFGEWIFLSSTLHHLKHPPHPQREDWSHSGSSDSSHRSVFKYILRGGFIALWGFYV